MKKFMLILFFGALSVACATSFEDNLVKLIESQGGAKIKIEQTQNLKSTKEIKLVVIEVVENSQRVPIFATKDGNMVIGVSQLIFTNSSDDETLVSKVLQETMDYNENSQKIGAQKLIESLKPEQYITLESSAKNAKTYFIVADPNCGYCREEFRNIDERLKTHNVNLVLVGILGKDSLQKAAWAMNKITSSTSQKSKMSTLKEMFSNNFKAPSDVDTSAIESTTDNLFKTGIIKGVPYIYEQ